MDHRCRRIRRDQSDQPVRRILEHPKLPFVSYPYEWPFSLLKRAALLHLQTHLRALDFGFTLSDASAYNVQFLGVKPIFIDTLSFVPYREGDYWAGQRQFVEQFLNPLLLRSLVGVSPNAWYRGALEGLPTEEFVHLIGRFRRWFNPNLLTNITLPALLQRKARRAPDLPPSRLKPLPKKALLFILRRLHDWICRLQPKDVGSTEWQGYEADNDSYAGDEEGKKQRFVAQFSLAATPSCAWDIGCNTGKYSEVLLQNATKSVIGFDFDLNALEAAVARASSKHLQSFLCSRTPPIQVRNKAGPKSSGLDCVPASMQMRSSRLHSCIIWQSAKIFRCLLSWIGCWGVAPRGVIEFVPKSDPMIQRMLRLRKDIFSDYNKDAFERALCRHGRIARVLELSPGGRTLYEYDRLSR